MRSGSVAAAIAGALALTIPIAAAGCAKPRPVVAPPPATPDPIQRLRAGIDTLLDQPGHRHGLWGIAIHSLTRDERLYGRLPRTLLVPASAMKVVTTAAAAEAVGWNHVFETTLSAAGSVVDGVLHGDLVITGTGDPGLFARPGNEPFDPWLDALRSRGITRIEGRVIGDDDLVEEPRPGFGWSWEDLGYTYGAIPGALNAGENTVQVTVVPAKVEGLPAIIELPSHARDLPIANRVRTAPAGAAAVVWPEYRAGDVLPSLNGAIGLDAPPATVSAAAGNPTEWFARAFRNRLLAAGIDVAGLPADIDDLLAKPDRSRFIPLHVHRSPPLAEIAKPLMKDSINLHAEALLRLATGVDGVRTADAGLDAVRARLESWGIPKEGIQIVDGSGLSRRNVIAAETLVAILARFHDPAGASAFMQTLAIAGRDGSLASRMKGTPAEANAVGKTGSMSNIRTFAGYVRTAEGEPLAVVIMANNFEGRAADVSATIDAILVLLARWTRVQTTSTPLPP